MPKSYSKFNLKYGNREIRLELEEKNIIGILSAQKTKGLRNPCFLNITIN
ncbi:MAG: hypothetical protein XD85_0180 [Parcubacteria bacterium 34_609]|nr:MAG: hypothetical protein XD85_0180 [Parcubacteria bacterium 34_609]